jgi:hypothetical protein
VNGGRGAALGEGVEEDVGVEGWGTGDGGDAGEEGAAPFARGSLIDVVITIMRVEGKRAK